MTGEWDLIRVIIHIQPNLCTSMKVSLSVWPAKLMPELTMAGGITWQTPTSYHLVSWLEWRKTNSVAMESVCILGSSVAKNQTLLDEEESLITSKPWMVMTYDEHMINDTLSVGESPKTWMLSTGRWLFGCLIPFHTQCLLADCLNVHCLTMFAFKIISYDRLKLISVFCRKLH